MRAVDSLADMCEKIIACDFLVHYRYRLRFCALQLWYGAVYHVCRLDANDGYLLLWLLSPLPLLFLLLFNVKLLLSYINKVQNFAGDVISFDGFSVVLCTFPEINPISMA